MFQYRKYPFVNGFELSLVKGDCRLLEILKKNPTFSELKFSYGIKLGQQFFSEENMYIYFRLSLINFEKSWQAASSPR